MNSKAFTLALVIAGFSMFMVYSYIEDQSKSLFKKFGQEQTVVVAKQDIKELELLDDSKVTLKTVPSKFLAPGHYKTIKEIENTIALTPIMKGEQITKPRLAYPGEKTGLARQVSVGKRAVAILVNENQAVGKLIKPGDRVDVIANFSYIPGRMDKTKTSTVLQDVLVLSTGFNMTNSIPMVGLKVPNEIKAMNLNTYSRYNSVTLELDPFQSQKIIFIIKNMDSAPFLSLRNNDDKDQLRIPTTDLYDVLDESKSDAREYFKKLDER
ncbi:MAG: Flp pilus assembly protein CpaB [Halobacteriovoraceae bacterium]|nr:Flp pilus assembly protein CpaB [Halobacteriovoraceae bacterium]